MRWRIGLVVSAALTLSRMPVSAQSLPVKVFHDFKYAVTDVFAVWLSPFQGSASDYATTGLILGTMGAATLIDDDVAAWARTHRKAGVFEVLKPFRERESQPKLINLGAGRSIVEISAGLYVVGLVSGSDDLRDAAMGCATAEKTNGLVRHYIYKAVSRERPLFQEVVGTDTILRAGHPYDIRYPSRDPWWDNSFPAGHGSNVISCVSFLNHRFDLGIAEPVLWTVALGISVGRIADQRHYVSDVIAGTVLGYAMGRYIAERSLAREAKREERSADTAGGTRPGLQSLLDGLYIGPHADGFAVGWQRRF